jgi:DNA processing protein
MTAISDDDRLARAALTWITEPGDTRLNALLHAHGPAAALDMIRSGNLPGSAGEAAADPVRRAADRWRGRLAEVPGPGRIARLLTGGIRLICPGDTEWPRQLDDLAGVRPYALWARGTAGLGSACRRSVAMTGSRAATAYGTWVAGDLAAGIAAAGQTVISGAAYGIDAAAHRGALTAGAPTVAVLAGGVDRPYPAGHKDLLDAIAAAGVVVSEWPPGRNPSRLRFLLRNRVIAALAAGTVVVEAAQRSGALNTARHARDLGRTLMAVPGPVTSCQSAGCHTIIRDWNATLITGSGDITAALAAGQPAAGG